MYTVWSNLGIKNVSAFWEDNFVKYVFNDKAYLNVYYFYYSIRGSGLGRSGIHYSLKI